MLKDSLICPCHAWNAFYTLYISTVASHIFLSILKGLQFLPRQAKLSRTYYVFCEACLTFFSVQLHSVPLQDSSIRYTVYPKILSGYVHVFLWQHAAYITIMTVLPPFFHHAIIYYHKHISSNLLLSTICLSTGLMTRDCYFLSHRHGHRVGPL